MNATLLDINVLLALFLPRHVFHAAASEWFRANQRRGWATCPLTEAGFVRLVSQPRVVPTQISVQEALDVLEENCSHSDHVFWSMEVSVSQMLPEIRSRLSGHQQLTDAILLDLAIRKGGRLATLDRRALLLLPADSPHRSAIEIFATE